ncbi:MAG: peptidoglycan-binding protein [Acutalibacteraceae bacterium]
MNIGKKNSKKFFKSLLAFILSGIIFFSMTISTVSAAVIKGKTGIGMAEWAFRAYNEGWVYKYGGSSAGAVDCSGLIRSYCNGQGGGAKALLNASSVNGSTNDMPRIHGLGLWCEGHAGVYVGKNKDGVDMAIDMRNSKVNVVYSAMSSRYYSPWLKWFKISMISYPTTGWFDFNGERFYYKNGEFCVGVVKVDGKMYDFGKSGALIGEVDPSQITTTKKTTTTTKLTTTTTKKTTTTTKLTTTTTKKTTTTTEKTTTTIKQTTTTKKTTSSAVTDKDTTTTKKQTTTTAKTTAKTSKKPTTTTKKTTTEKTTSKTAKKTTETTKGKTTTQDTASTTKPTTTAKPTTTTTAIVEYQGGMTGDGVPEIQRRLYELGYYDQDITNYYGPFTRDAIKSFQKAIGVLPTGIADAETQKALFADDAPYYSEDNSLMLDEAYQIDGEDIEEEKTEAEQEEIPVIAASEGISSLSMTANPYDFTRSYGESGALETMGVFSYKSPSVKFYRNGESYEVSEEMMQSLNECVFL